MNKEQIKKVANHFWLKAVKKTLDPFTENGFKTCFENYLKDIETEQDSEENWISVKDRLPERNEMVICARKHGSMSGYVFMNPTLGKLKDNSNRFTCDMDWINTTHWMPLPENPKE